MRGFYMARRPAKAVKSALSAPEAERFLFAEARMLDERRFDEWETLFTDDGSYWVPIDPRKALGQGVSIISDDRKRIHERVYRLTQTPVLDQNPPSRTIRFVS
ncbi:MAG: ring-hydroxylating dioxygenase subunit beta, partial [Bacillati bacterium ANGP1]